MVASRSRGTPRISFPRHRQRLPPEQWPQRDHFAWLAAISSDDPLTRNPARHWRPATRENRWKHWGAFIAVLETNDRLDVKADPRERLTPELVDLLVVSLRTHLSANSLRTFLQEFSVVAAVLVPGFDASWIRRHPLRPTSTEAKATQRKRGHFDPEAAIRAAIRDMAEVEKLPLTRKSAIRFRDDLVFATATALPIRHRNMVQMDVGTHLREIGDGFLVSFDPDETKTHRWFRADLPTRLCPFMRRWLDHYRKFLVGDRSEAALWVNQQNRSRLRRHYARFLMTGKRLLDQRIHPHLTRHSAATEILRRHPAKARLAADVLHHVTTRGARGTYDHSNSYAVQRAYRELLQRDRRRRRADDG